MRKRGIWRLLASVSLLTLLATLVPGEGLAARDLGSLISPRQPAAQDAYPLPTPVPGLDPYSGPTQPAEDLPYPAPPQPTLPPAPGTPTPTVTLPSPATPGAAQPTPTLPTATVPAATPAPTATPTGQVGEQLTPPESPTPVAAAPGEPTPDRAATLIGAAAGQDAPGTVPEQTAPTRARSAYGWFLALVALLLAGIVYATLLRRQRARDRHAAQQQPPQQDE